MNIKKVGVIGFSAGGNLAARLARSLSDAKSLNFLALIYPALIDDKNSSEISNDAMPVGMPVFLYVAKDDSKVKDCDRYAEICRQKGIRCVYEVRSSGGHGFGIRQQINPQVKDLSSCLKSFLDSL